jgi:bacterioferritin-associated ferredoxin
MYLCLCKGITLEMAKKMAQKSGHARDLAQKLGVGSDCGSCLMGALEDLEKGLNLSKPQEKSCQFSKKAS